jgi:hypothetical protein
MQSMPNVGVRWRVMVPMGLSTDLFELTVCTTPEALAAVIMALTQDDVVQPSSITVERITT